MKSRNLYLPNYAAIKLQEVRMSFFKKSQDHSFYHYNLMMPKKLKFRFD